MKNIFTLLLLFTSQLLFAQIDRSKAPSAGPAPKLQMGKYESFTLPNGLQVFVVENRKLPVVSFNLRLDKDPIIEGKNAGLSDLTGQMLARGTKNATKAQIDESIDKIGAQFSASSEGFYASSLKKHQKQLLEVVSDVLLNPTFPEEELEKLKKLQVQSIVSGKSSDAAIARNVRSAINFGSNHPYGEVVSESSIESINAEMCKDYYNTFFKANIGYLAIVGDINLNEAKQLASTYFGNWKAGDVPSIKYPEAQLPSSTRVAIANKVGAVQSNIAVTYPVNLKFGHPDVIPVSVMNEILGGGSFGARLVQNLRETNAWTYGAYSNLSPNQVNSLFFAGANVRNSVTDSAVMEILKEMARMRTEKVSDDAVKNVLSRMSGAFARSLESPQTIARFALNTAIYKLPADYYVNYLENLNKVTADQIQEVANKYIQPENANIVIVGNRNEVTPMMEKFGTVKFYDFYGNEVKKAATPLPAGLTAEKVIEDYIIALGGVKNLKKVKDVTSVYVAEIQGTKLEITNQQKAPNKSLNKVEANGVIMQKTTFNGTTGKQNSMMGNKVLEGKDLEELKWESYLFGELNYATLGFKMELTGIEEIEGQNAYVVEVTNPAGTKSTQYYSTSTNLKIREMKTMDTPNGQFTQVTDLKDYKAVNGVMFPHTVVQSFGPQNIESKIKTLTVNGKLKDDVFN